MAGHSQFKNIMHRKNAQDQKRAKIFTKLIRELTISARGGEDPTMNPRLRAAILAARSANMPKDNIERAIKKGAGGDQTESYEEVRYEGYGPGGTAIIVEALTDNRNRTASEIRSAFSKLGGSLGETNSVAYMFDHCGLVIYPQTIAAADDMLENALDSGANDLKIEDEHFIILGDSTDLHAMEERLTAQYGSPESAQLSWIPNVWASPTVEQRQSLAKLIDILEDNDDVQRVIHNCQDDF